MNSICVRPSVRPSVRPPGRPPGRSLARRVPAALAGTGAAAATTGLGAALARTAGEAWDGLRGPAEVTPEEVLTGVVAGVGAALCLWLVLGFVISLGAALPGGVGGWARRLSERTTPLVVRRVAAAVLGGALVATGATPALAATTPGPASAGSRAVVLTVAWPAAPTDPSASPAPATPGEAYLADRLSPDLAPAAPEHPPTVAPARPVPVVAPGLGALGPRSPRPAVTPATFAPTAGRETTPTTSRAGRGSVTVTAGDTLWSIAAARLGARAQPGDISRAWPRWFAANRAVVGPDPDHISPGQVLEAPSDSEGR